MKIAGIVGVLLVGVVIFYLIGSRPTFRVGDRVQVALKWRAVPMADGSPSNDPIECGTVVSGTTLGDLGIDSSRFVTIKFDDDKNPSHEFDPIYNVEVLEPCSPKEQMK